MHGTRPDIAVAVSVLSRYLDRPTTLHCYMVKRVYRHLMANLRVGLHKIRKLEANTGSHAAINITCYSDASYANSYDSRSMSGFGILLSGSLISWYSHTQSVVALSTAEAEYIALTDIAKKVVWMKLLLSELGHPQADVVVFEDNQASIRIAKNPQDHKRTKHIRPHYHYIRDQIKDGILRLEYIPTQNQLADIFTKALNGPRLRALRTQLGIALIPDSGGELRTSLS